MYSLVIALLVLGVFFLSVWKWMKKTARMIRIMKQIPGPPGFFYPVGNSDLFLKVDHLGFFKQIQVCNNAFGRLHGMFKLWMGPAPYVVITKGSVAEVVFSSMRFIEKSHDYDYFQPWLATGLLTSTGPKWKSRRKFLTPAFHFQILDGFTAVFYEQSLVMVKLLSKLADSGQSFDISPYIFRCTLDIICETAMGRTIHAQTRADSSYVQAVYRSTEMIFDRMVKPHWRYDFIYNTIGPGKLLETTLKRLHDFTDSVILERQAALSKNLTEDRKETASRRLAFLDMLLTAKTEDGEPLDNLSIREEVDTFMFEGHDTTGAAAGFAIFLLGCYPEVQNRAYEEVLHVLGNGDKPVTNDDLKQLVYLEAVIKETLRLYPSVPMISRKCPEDITSGSLVIPKGCTINLNIYTIQRNPDVYTEPDSFLPERFLENSDLTQKISPFDYVPFSAGPRNCIGQKFALMEEKVILSTLLRHFRIESIETPAEMQVHGELIMRPVNGIQVKLTKRAH
ncbi:hypothetical protein RvY_09902 [Ramazzottius varieornatus]|uniref:Cytochrome P450 n=1 Tax=Ramazzottius varieornatus TaxID=947166 RepID=A0A1D1VAZ4_RAMVA|nr:hypothetical protein RvY_09902 [Ramazzottius varieornatus]